MNKIKNISTSVAFSILIVFLFAGSIGVAGCLNRQDKWTGNLDAVFMYQTEEQVTTVHEATPHSKCTKAGILAGDVLIAANGKPLTGITVQELTQMLTGPVGSFVLLTIRRENEMMDFKVERTKKTTK